MPPSNTPDTLFIIPHTHWEGAVFQTRAAYLDMGLPNILRAMALLKTYPNYRFTLDQLCYVKPFLERYPQEEPAFRQFIAEGRLAIVGGTDTMLDVNMPGGESFVRQVLLAKGYFRDKLGVDVTVGWQLDTFGHHAQMPQLLKLAGFKSFWFFRGVPDWDTPADFLWEGLDGSRIPAYWLPESYAFGYGTPTTLPGFAAFAKQRYDHLARWYPGPHRAAPSGPDVVPPEEHLPALAAEYAALPDAAPQVCLATPLDYEAVAAPGPDAPVLRCELNPVFQGIYSSRIELKQITRRLEVLLTTAEKLGVMLASLGVPTCDARLWDAWEPMLFNQAHDLMSGVMTDCVYEDSMGGYDFSRRIAEDEVETRLRTYTAAVDTTGDALPLLVFNALGHARTDAVITTVGFAEDSIAAIRVLDPAGAPVPSQLLRELRNATGGLVEAEIAFMAQGVPALGHAVYRVLPCAADDPNAAVASAPDASGLLDSDLLRVQVDAATGAITSLVTKADGGESLSAPGNIVVREEDHGDLWEPYHSLDGGSRIAMTVPHPIPPRGEAVYSDEQTAEPGQGFSGPVLSQFTVEHPFGDQGHFTTTVRIFAGLSRVEVHTRILNQDKFVRYRAVFPTTISGGTVTHEIPFGAIQRPAGIEFPAQNWADYAAPDHGLALLNRGLPGNAVSEDALILSLFRSTCIVAYGFGGGYGPGMSSDSGFELGKELAFDYALLPHSGGPQDSGVVAQGAEFNCPLIALPTAAHTGALQPESAFVTVTPANVTVSAMKQSRNGTAVLRIYESAGRPTPDAKLRLPANVTRVVETDLMEDPTADLTTDGGVLHLSLGAYEIKTLRLNFAPGPIA